MLFASWLLLRKSVIFYLLGRVKYLFYLFADPNLLVLSSVEIIHFFETQNDDIHTEISILLLNTQLQSVEDISFRNLINLFQHCKMFFYILVIKLGLHIAHSSE